MFYADCYTILLVYSVYRKRNIHKKVLIVSCGFVVFYAVFVVVYVCFSFFCVVIVVVVVVVAPYTCTIQMYVELHILFSEQKQQTVNYKRGICF